MATTIAVHHAGSGEAHGGYPRIKIWCDIRPNLELKRLFNDEARSIEGIVSIIDSAYDHAHVELIIDPTVNIENTASSWIKAANDRLAKLDEEDLRKFYTHNLFAGTAVDSRNPTFHFDEDSM